jgi:hypothetical protein
METLTQLLTAWMIMYVALLVFPVILKIFGLDIFADPLIKLITRVMFPFWLLRWLVQAMGDNRPGPQARPDEPPPGLTDYPAEAKIDPGWYWVESGPGQPLRITGPYNRAGNVITKASDQLIILQVYHREGADPPTGWYWATPARGHGPLALQPEDPSGPIYYVYG